MYLEFKITEDGELVQFAGSAMDAVIVCARLLSTMNSRLHDQNPETAKLFRKSLKRLVADEGSPLFEYEAGHEGATVIAVDLPNGGKANDKD